MENKLYDCIIVGGGLAGLSLSILMAQKKYSVLLIEKKSYPYHKVCGEYISMESWDFLERIGIPLREMNLPRISKFEMTDIRGQRIHEHLEMGGFGISRYTLDHLLAEKAIEIGVTLMQNTICSGYEYSNEIYIIKTNRGEFKGKLLSASFGRHSFGNFYKPKKNNENWVGVKYHIKTDFPSDKIELHTFNQGYCGISKVDKESYCVCYIVKASLLNQYQNNIDRLQSEELYKNPYLKNIFKHATLLYKQPLTISNITFDPKLPIYEHVFYLGDSAGSIAPLTGNGMSNAMRSAWILSHELDLFLQGEISRTQLENNYIRTWNKNFKRRMTKGRWIQHFFCHPTLTPFFIKIIKQSQWLRKMIIKQTHGESF